MNLFHVFFTGHSAGRPGLNALWKSVARLPLNIRLAGFTAGLFPSLRDKKMTQCYSVAENTQTHTRSKRRSGLMALVSFATLCSINPHLFLTTLGFI